MDPLTLVISALAAGASTGLTGAAGTAISDAYTALKDLIRRRLSDKGKDPGVVDRPETDPAKVKADLAGKLTAADIDEQIIAAATALLQRTDPQGAQVGKYVVTIENSKGVIVGDGNTVNQTFT
ncbi:hypothetical protein [Mycolicibacterium sp.]|uniref:hypothetical protein n=1 Tax=Mycolicibacterium sp. TaxID=2320850 RepID=UPI003D0A4840